ncbi:hypothetical protein V6N12_036434 [Hibiscus sabdariffa]|uniref:Reverse transcriptase zinc-binding domain-containing protein n=1 Tax=Hibiscus sabdariffa TaxID=183260 RepID=A0ABR2EQL4_9ROSI
MRVPHKVQCLNWFILLDRLPTLQMLSMRGVPLLEIECKWCGTGMDALDHIFLHCEVARRVWELCFQWWHLEVVFSQSIGDLLWQCFHGFFTSIEREWWLACCAALVRSLWLARNALMFKGNRFSIREIFFQVRIRSLFWIRAFRESDVIEEL